VKPVPPKEVGGDKGSDQSISGEGQSRRFDRAPVTSGLPRAADILSVGRDVSNVPLATSPESSDQKKSRPKAAPQFKSDDRRSGEPPIPATTKI
jgi:hypothetical protein